MFPPAQKRVNFKSHAQLALGVGVFFILFALLYVGFYLRTNGMMPIEQALLYQTDYDEGVNVSAAQLFLQGYMPYRDYLFVQPPFAILIFASILKLHFVTWGDATAFVLARYAAISFGMATLGGVFVMSRRLGGTLSGLVSTGILAIDGLVVEIDRRAMLEPHTNALSILAVLCYLTALRREKWRNGWMFAAGVLGASAALVKTAGALTLFSILIYAGLRLGIPLMRSRRPCSWTSVRDSWRTRLEEFVMLCAGAVITIMLIAGYFLATAPVQFIRQVYVFQLFRPADGPSGVADRFAGFLSSDSSHLTIYFALAGAGLLLLRAILRLGWGQWGLILIWTLAVSAFFAISRTFYPHYYVQLALPLSLLGGALVCHAHEAVSTKSALANGKSLPSTQQAEVSALPVSRTTAEPESSRVPRWKANLVLAAQVVTLALLMLTNHDTVIIQYARAQSVSTFRSPILRDVSHFLETHGPKSQVLVFQPAFAFAASLEPVGPDDKTALIDSYGYLQYITMSLDAGWVPDPPGLGLMDALQGADAQGQIQEMSTRAKYIVIDQRARWQLTPATLSNIIHGRRAIYRRDGVAIYSDE